MLRDSHTKYMRIVAMVNDYIPTVSHWYFLHPKVTDNIQSVIVSAIFETFSIAIFGIGAYQVYDVSINSWVARFEWAFYIGIAALFNCFFAGILFIIGGIRMTKEMKGYSSYAWSDVVYKDQLFLIWFSTNMLLLIFWYNSSDHSETEATMSISADGKNYT